MPYLQLATKITNATLRKVYVNLLLLAAYRVPIAIQAYPRSRFGLDGAGDINVLELVELLDLFTSPTPPEIGNLPITAGSDGQTLLYLLFPEVLLELLSKQNFNSGFCCMPPSISTMHSFLVQVRSWNLW
jgi:hypothetical protein